MTEKLKPCPFCGSRMVRFIDDCDEYSFIQCKDCSTTGPSLDDEEGFPALKPTHNELKQIWNRRQDWITFWKATKSPSFQYGFTYPAKFPTAPKEERYGTVSAIKDKDGTISYSVNGSPVPTLNSPLEDIIPGDPLMGSVLVLNASLEH